jgi:chromate reductase
MNIGIIVGTNRQDAVSEKIAQYYSKALFTKNISNEILYLKKLPRDFAFSALYGQSDPDFHLFQEKFDTFDKIILVIPEYNGSFPGVLKTFIDALRHPDSFSRKKVALVGVSSGAYGNAVGLSHISDVLAYLNADVMGLRLKLANILKHFNNGVFSFEVYANFVEKQIDAFIEF